MQPGVPLPFYLEQRTVRAVLNLEEDFASFRGEVGQQFLLFKEQVMSALSDLQTEMSEFRTSIGNMGTALSGISTRFGAVADQLAAAITPEQMAAAKVESDALQVQLNQLVDVANAIGAGQSPPPIDPNAPPPLPDNPPNPPA